MNAKEQMALVDALVGRNPAERNAYVGRTIYSRGGDVTGTVTAVDLCRLDGCGGLRLHVKWSDGGRTYPCNKGCDERPDGHLQIH